MSSVDIIILIILAIFVWKGIKLGLIEAVGGILGIFVGLFMAAKYAPVFAESLQGLLFNSELLSKIIAFLLVYIVVNRAIALLFWIIDKVFHIVAIIPGLKGLNSLLGGLLGLVEAVIFISVISLFLSYLPLVGNFKDKIDQSRFGGLIMTVENIIEPFMPDSLISWASRTTVDIDIPLIEDPS